MSFRRLATFVLSAAAALLAAIVLYLAFGDLSRHKGRLEALVSEKIGRPFAIEGRFELQVLPSIAVVAEKVRLGNAEWGSQPQMVEVGRFATKIGLWSLVSGPVDIRSLELSDVSVLLEKDRAGKGNWVLGEASPSGEVAESPGAGVTEVPAVIEDARLGNLRLTYREPGKPDRVAFVETLTVAPGADGLLAISGKGKLKDYTATLAGEFGPLNALLSGRDMRIAMQAAIGNLRLDVKGGLGRLNPLEGADLTLKVDHSDLGAMLERLDLPSFASGALSVNARLTGAGERTRLEVDAKLGDITVDLDGTLRTLGLAGSDIRFAFATASLAKLQEGLPKIAASLGGEFVAGRGRIDLKGLKGRVGESAFAGRASIVQARRTRVEADLASPQLDLTPFLAQEPGDKRKAKEAPARKFLFGEERLPLDGLKGADAKLRLAAGELRFGAGSLKDFESTLTVDGGRLALESRAKGGVDGTLDVSLALVPERGGAADLKVSVSARGLRTGFGAGKAIEPGQTPATGVEASLTAKGASARQMAAGANGRLLFTVGPGKIESSIVGVLGGDTLSELTGRLNPFSAKDPYTQLDCTVARVDIVDGQAAVKPVLMQSEKVTVVAGGAIDLRAEELDLSFNTRPRTGVGISPGMFTNPFIELAGTLTSPRIGVSAKGAAAAVATGGVTVLAQGVVDRLLGGTDQCKKTLDEATTTAKK